MAAGTWQDPPGYFDRIVYPEYEKNNQYPISRITSGDSDRLVAVDSSKLSIGQSVMRILTSLAATLKI
jgi:hypothetical protein